MGIYFPSSAFVTLSLKNFILPTSGASSAPTIRLFIGTFVLWESANITLDFVPLTIMFLACRCPAQESQPDTDKQEDFLYYKLHAINKFRLHSFFLPCTVDMIAKNTGPSSVLCGIQVMPHSVAVWVRCYRSDADRETSSARIPFGKGEASRWYDSLFVRCLENKHP